MGIFDEFKRLAHPYEDEEEDESAADEDQRNEESTEGDSPEQADDDSSSEDNTSDQAGDPEEMRAAAGVSLEAAMLKGMRFCITDLVQSGQVIHTDSVEAYNEIIIAGTA